MNNTTRESEKRPTIVTILAIVNLLAFVVTVLFWSFVFFQRLVPFPADLTTNVERANSAVTYGFMLGDMFFSVPLLFLAAIGLWKLRSWGWLAAQIVNILWMFSMTVIFFRDAYTSWSPGSLIFLPFVLIAVLAIPYLWIRRRLFGVENSPAIGRTA